MAPDWRSALRPMVGLQVNVIPPIPVGTESELEAFLSHPATRMTASFFTGCGAARAYCSTIAAAVPPSASKRPSLSLDCGLVGSLGSWPGGNFAPRASRRQVRAAARAAGVVGHGDRIAKAQFSNRMYL